MPTQRMKWCFLLLAFLLTHNLISQEAENKDSLVLGSRQKTSKAKKDSIDREELHIGDYRYWKEGERRFYTIDTTLSIENYYKQNFTQKDPYGNMEFPNQGQTFNPLTYTISKEIRPQLLPTGKSYNYLHEEDIRYFDVKTPTTELIYENGVKEGQALSSLFTHSPNRNFNYSLQYRGLRSLGRYNYQLSNNQEFIVSTRYGTENTRYKAWGHYASHNIHNQENGGIDSTGLVAFLANNTNFKNRGRFTTNLIDAKTRYEARRVHIGQRYKLLVWEKYNVDSTRELSSINLKYLFTLDDQDFLYGENQNNSFYKSDVITGMSRSNEKQMDVMRNKFLIEWLSTNKIYFSAGAMWENVKYENPTDLTVNNITVPAQFKTNLFSVLGSVYARIFKQVDFSADAQYTSASNLSPQYLFYAKAAWEFSPGYTIKAEAIRKEALPSYNYLLNQSFYQDFNFYNQFSPTKTSSIGANLNVKKLHIDIKARYSNIQNWVYLSDKYIPVQENNHTNLLELEWENTLKYKSFYLTSRLTYQKFQQEEKWYPIPEFIARASLYYQDKAFDNNAEIQTGLSVYYYTQFQSRQFFPILNEFALPTEEAQPIGNYPYMDAFLNLKVDRMRIYIRAQHFNSLFSKQKYLSDPVTPYRDFKFQIGLKWYLFT